MLVNRSGNGSIEVPVDSKPVRRRLGRNGLTQECLCLTISRNGGLARFCGDHGRIPAVVALCRSDLGSAMWHRQGRATISGGRGAKPQHCINKRLICAVRRCISKGLSE